MGDTSEVIDPLVTAVFGIALLHEQLGPRRWMGLILGMAGVGLVVGHAALESATRFDGLLLAFIGVMGLVAGTLYFGRFCRGISLLPGAAAQFLSAAAQSALGAWLLETPPAEWTFILLVAIVWNVVMVSFGGIGLYVTMLVSGTAARASANFYLVPGTASLLAWVFLGERLTLLAIAGLLAGQCRVTGGSVTSRLRLALTSLVSTARSVSDQIRRETFFAIQLCLSIRVATRRAAAHNIPNFLYCLELQNAALRRPYAQDLLSLR